MSELLNNILVILVFFILPAAILIWFAVSVVLFLRTPKDSPRRRPRKLRLVIASVLFGLLIIAAVVFFILLSIAIAHM